ncbi:MAG: IS110 family transposase [Roseovarius sp.]|nr:IS110 family transposase [Roseovarius sp.]
MIHPVFIGCDVSKSHLDLFDSMTDQHLRIDNTQAAIEAWLGTVEGRNGTVILEATGRYDRCLCAALERHGRPYCRVNPARARDFARAAGLLAKTDAIDARMLARMGQTLSPSVSKPPDPTRRRLAEMHTRRDQLVAMRQQERVRVHSAEPTERDSIERHIAWLDAEITSVEKACLDHVRADKSLSEQNARLRSIPGIGVVTAFTLLAHMPELGDASPKAVAALAGLAPFNVDSGMQRGQRHIRGGRKRVRDALYMAALVAYRLNKPFLRIAQAMADKGKPFKVMIIAIARKILITANALIRDKATFQVM